MSDIITGGVLSVCNFVVKCFRERKKKNLRHTAPLSFLLFLSGFSIHEITKILYIYSIKSRYVIAVFQRHA